MKKTPMVMEVYRKHKSGRVCNKPYKTFIYSVASLDKVMPKSVLVNVSKDGEAFTVQRRTGWEPRWKRWFWDFVVFEFKMTTPLYKNLNRSLRMKDHSNYPATKHHGVTYALQNAWFYIQAYPKEKK